jgi:ADP-heptose:LPS heptosyltransferase
VELRRPLTARPAQVARLDSWLGKPLCALVTGWDALKRRLFEPRRRSARRLLFIKLNEMGSTVLACSAFAEAERTFGRNNLFILVFAQNRPILDLLPYFESDHVLAVDDRNLLRFALSLARALWTARRLEIDVAIDMEGLSCASALIAYLSGSAQRVGLFNFTSYGPYRGRLFTRELNYTFHHHVSLQFLGLVRAARDGSAEALFKEPTALDAQVLPRFVPELQELAAVRDWLHSLLQRTPERIAILNPNCSDLLPLRRWPAEHFVELGKRLSDQDPGLALVITGSDAERPQAEALAAAIGSHAAVSIAGRTTLRELLVLYCASDVLISNDSGPVHFASLTPIGVVALFGPETPVLYGPLGERAVSLSLGLPCSPCVNLLNHRVSPCTDNQCMKRLHVDRVFAATQALLERRHA